MTRLGTRTRRPLGATLIAAVLALAIAGCSPAVPTPAVSPSTAPTGSAEAPSPSPTAPPPSVEPTTSYATATSFWTADRGLAGETIDQPDGGASGRLLSTTDAGRTWAVVMATGAPVLDLAVAGTADAWALTGCHVGSACQGRLYHSVDGGATWTSAPTDLSWISFVDAGHGWGVAGGSTSTEPPASALRRTADGGRTWTTVTSPCAGSAVGPLRAVAFRSATEGMAVCALTAGAGGELHAVLATRDAGAHWSVRASTGGATGGDRVGAIPYGGYIGGMVEAGDGTAWITGDRMVPLVSRDDGATWTPLGIGDPAADLVSAAWPLDARLGVALMWAPDRQATLFEATADGGRTWVERFAWAASGSG